MRIITDELLLAQQGNYIPYINLVFHDRDDNNTLDYSLVDDATNRIIRIQHHEKMYDGYAFIVLRNNDKAIPDLRGWWVEIGYGADTSDFGGSGVEYEKTARLWVANQQTQSAPGVSVTVLFLEDIWRRLSRHKIITLGVAPYFEYAFNSETGGDGPISTILQWIIETNLAQHNRPYMASTLTFPASQDDGIINIFSPYFVINQAALENASDIIQRLLSLTKVYLRTRKDMDFEIRYPQAGDAVDATYYTTKAPAFNEFVETESVRVPNLVQFFGGWDEINGWDNFILSFTDPDDIGDNEELVEQIIALPYVSEQGELDAYKDAYVLRVQNRRVAGRMIIRHDCRLELHDNIQILDSR